MRGRSRDGRPPASPGRRRPGRRPAPASSTDVVPSKEPSRVTDDDAPSTAAAPSAPSAGWARRATRRRMVAWADSGSTVATEPAPRDAASLAISETNRGLPPVRSVTARVSTSPGSWPVVAVISVRTSSAGSPRSNHDSPRVATWAASSRCSEVTSASWSRQPQTTSTARSERSVVRNCSSRNDPASTQCTSSSRSTTGRSRARSSITPSTASNNGNRPGTSTCAPPVPSSNGSASRARSPHSSGGRTPAAARTTWDQTQNDGVPGSSQPVPRRTVHPSARAATSASTRVLPMPASPWIQSTPPCPARQSASSASARARTSSRPSSGWLFTVDSSLTEGTGSG